MDGKLPKRRNVSSGKPLARASQAMPYSRANKVDIWYEVAGDGPAMILVHANPFDNTLWTYQVSLCVPKT
jgi:hypothetical protein